MSDDDPDGQVNLHGFTARRPRPPRRAGLGRAGTATAVADFLQHGYARVRTD